MNQTRAGIYFIILVFALFGLVFSQPKKAETPPQPKQQVTQKPSDEEGKVLAGCFAACDDWKFTIKDSLTGSFITDATAEMMSKDKFDYCLQWGTGEGRGWVFTYISQERAETYFWSTYANAYLLSCELKSGMSSPTTISVKITKNGYESKTASVNETKILVPAPVVFLSKSTTTTPTTTTTTTTTVQQETIKDVTLPSVFGAKSTDLSNISDPAKVKKLTFDVVGKNRIVFSDTVNLSSDKARDLFKKLDKYVKMTKLGVVELNSKTLSMLAKKKATVSMFKLPFLDTPDILVNGKPDTKKVVSNIKYKKGTLTFSVKKFSKFEAVPKLNILEPKNGFIVEQESITLKGKISDPEASVSAKLNNQSLGKLKVATKSGEFSKQLTLKKGRNNILVQAISKFGTPLEATVSGIFLAPIESKSYVLGTVQIVSMGALVILLLAIVGAWWYYRKKKANAQ